MITRCGRVSRHATRSGRSGLLGPRAVIVCPQAHDVRCPRGGLRRLGRRPEICEYPDSGKYMAYDKGFRGAQRTAANLDYWDGEP